MAMNYDERAAYTKAYKKARKTTAGSPKALLGGKVANEAGKTAADAVKEDQKSSTVGGK